jgi:hypothetical protein
MRKDVYKVKVAIQWLLGGVCQDFNVKTLASSKEEAEVNIREQFRTAYYTQIKEVK